MRNNPLKYTDPSGHFANVIVGAAIGAVIGAAVSAGPQMIKNVREGQPLTTNIDPGEVAKAAAIGAVGGAVAGATFGVALAAAPAVGLGTGLGAHVAAGAASGVVAGQASRATGNVLNGQRITQGLGNPGEMARNAALGGAGGAIGYGIGKVINAASRTDVVLSGHGGYIQGDGMTTVPDGTSVTTYSKFGGGISNHLGNAIETGEIPSGIHARVWGPGQRMPNYTLYPPTGLTIMGNPITVQSPTQLSTLLRPAMGRIHWAACTIAQNVKWSGQVWDIGGVWYENLPH